jgi:hypothetical protein
MPNLHLSLCNSLKDVLISTMPMQICIDGCGDISVYPKQQRYITNIQDWQAINFRERIGVVVSAMECDEVPEGALPVNKLLWKIAFQNACHSPSDTVESNDLIKLASWPDLINLPEDLIAPVTRVCALLWRKPTLVYLVPKVLDASPVQTRAILKVLQQFGHVRLVAYGVPEKNDLTKELICASPPDMASAQHPISLIGKLWQRLFRS